MTENNGADGSAPRIGRGADLKYPHNELEGFANGCVLDLRVRLAINLLEHSPRYRSLDDGRVVNPEGAAGDALDLAHELMSQAEARGWVAPITESGALSAALEAQAKRTGAFQAGQQIEGGRVMRDAQRGVVPLAPGFAGKPN